METLKIKNIVQFVLLLLPIALMFHFCGKPVADKSTEVILAKIANKHISVDDFIRRAEYTIRPSYCNQDNYIHKKIILNSLIAEKLLALEAGEANELTRNQQFQDYIRGRQEQAMRQWQYHEIAYQQVKLDSNEIKKIYQIAGRTYRLEYCSARDSSRINKIRDQLSAGAKSFAEIYHEHFGLDQVPEREVGWESQEDPSIHHALFSEKLVVGQIIGPLKTSDGNYLLMKIAGWTDRPAISDTDIRQRWNDVSEKLRASQADRIYVRYIANVMKGKRVEFARNTFFKLAEIVAPFYLKSLDDKREALQQKFWENEIAAEPEQWNLEEIIDRSLLQIDNQTWSVRDFLREISIHPLVFRQRKISQQEFPEQLKLAIVDLIRDKYLTQEAYKQGYHQVNAVKQNTEMWRDHLLALYQKNQFLQARGVEEKDYLRVIETYLNAYVDSLQKKYQTAIEIDTDEFEKIKLTRIDMFVLQRNMPYPIIVPSFPLVTTDHQLDYGSKISK